jgi:hypothetical protein
MLQATLCELSWHKLLNMLPIYYEPHRSLKRSKNYNTPKYHWVLKNIDFKQWSASKGPHVLCLTGQPSKDNLDKLISDIVDRKLEAGYSVVFISSSNMERTPTTVKLFYTFLGELIYRSPVTRRTTIIQNFFKRLLEIYMDKGNWDWKEEIFNYRVFSKYMDTILRDAATSNLLDCLKTAVDFAGLRRLLVIIDGVDFTTPDADFKRALSLLVTHLQQRKSKTKILLASPNDFKPYRFFENFVHIEYDKERKGWSADDGLL